MGPVRHGRHPGLARLRAPTATFSLVARSAVPSALQLNPPNAGSPKGVPINFTAAAVDTTGTPYAGRTLRYAITGANNPGDRAGRRSAPHGNAVITDPGTNAGADTVVAFVDFNNNGTREPAEPQASALATFVDSIPPSCTSRSAATGPAAAAARASR